MDANAPTHSRILCFLCIHLCNDMRGCLYIHILLSLLNLIALFCLSVRWCSPYRSREGNKQKNAYAFNVCKVDVFFFLERSDILSLYYVSMYEAMRHGQQHIEALAAWKKKANRQQFSNFTASPFVLLGIHTSTDVRHPLIVPFLCTQKVKLLFIKRPIPPLSVCTAQCGTVRWSGEANNRRQGDSNSNGMLRSYDRKLRKWLRALFLYTRIRSYFSSCKIVPPARQSFMYIQLLCVIVYVRLYGFRARSALWKITLAGQKERKTLLANNYTALRLLAWWQM